MTQPSERAMKAAVEMEIHASCGSTTLAKGKALDEMFPAYDELVASLRELYAIVRGECPSLLNEDSGGNAELEMAIVDALAKAGAA